MTPPKSPALPRWLVLFLFCSCLCLQPFCEAKELLRKENPSKSAKKEKKNKPRSRRERFPSVAERVKVYMSNWYLPPCASPSNDEEDNDIYYTYRICEPDAKEKEVQRRVQVSNFTFDKTIEPDMAFWLDEDVLMDCARSEEQFQQDQDNDVTLPTEDFIKFRHNMRLYCTDVVELVEILRHLDMEADDDSTLTNDETPILMQFGDMKHSHVFGLLNLPHIKKFRSATSNLKQVTDGQDCVSQHPRPILDTAHGSETLQPIVWKLATHRHYRFLPEVFKKDTPWKDKRNMAIFRGQLTGALESFDKTLTPLENCYNMRRCRLVYESDQSKLIDAKLTTTRNRLPDTINGVDMVVTRTGIEHLMEFKGIIMLEGNDVASGLKWALLSQSVVLMPEPKHTSWAMEELLEPWVHYIPLNELATDVKEKMQWVLDHDEEAQRIAERATMWMEDLVFHPDAARDDRLIKEEIIRRYRMHFKPA